MKSNYALRVLADITAYQWGMVTSRQANAVGVSRSMLSRLADAGHLQRLAFGVYKDSGVPSDGFDDLRAAWLSTEPDKLAFERLRHKSNGVVIASTSAALLHGIGDLWEGRHEFVAPVRRQSQRSEIRYRKRSLTPEDIRLVEGLPVMSIERTIADLVEEVKDISLVADVLSDVVIKRRINFDRLEELLVPLAARNGFKKDDGKALLNLILEEAGADNETLARLVAMQSELGNLVISNYLKNIKIDLPPESPKIIENISEKFTISDEIIAKNQEILSKILNTRKGGEE
ncbi:MAG: type IV toxin-antitoxin system AbiEi family antitoxin domain-containing protein [Micrococcaceae bacterium]